MMFHTFVGPICNFARIVQKTMIQQNERSMRKQQTSHILAPLQIDYETIKQRPSWKHDV